MRYHIKYLTRCCQNQNNSQVKIFESNMCRSASPLNVRTEHCKGKGHQSQREFVHIQSRQNVPHIKV